MADEKAKEEKPKKEKPAKKADAKEKKETAPAVEATAPVAAAEVPVSPAPAAGVPATAAAVLAEGETPIKKQKVKGAKHVPFGIVHILASFNNTIVTITDMRGAVIAWSSSGRGGFKGSRKSTAFAATVAAQEASRQATGHGLQEVEVRVQGPGAGRESAIRAIMAAGININAIKDVTPMPHNGCRARKRRRV